LQNAVSIASIFLTMEGAITDLPEDKGAASGHAGHDHGMGGMMGM